MYHSHMNDVMASYVLLQQGPFEGVLTDMETHRKHASHSQRDRDSRNPVPAFGPVKHAMRPAMSQLVLVLVAFSAGISLSRVGLSLGGTEADLLRLGLGTVFERMGCSTAKPHKVRKEWGS